MLPLTPVLSLAILAIATLCIIAFFYRRRKKPLEMEEIIGEDPPRSQDVNVDKPAHSLRTVPLAPPSDPTPMPRVPSHRMKLDDFVEAVTADYHKAIAASQVDEKIHFLSESGVVQRFEEYKRIRATNRGLVPSSASKTTAPYATNEYRV